MTSNKIIPKHIDHICLLVKNLNETQKYLEALFDFEIHPKPNSEKILMVENEYIHFFIQEENFSSEFLKEQHLSFKVDNIDIVAKKLDNMRIKSESGEFKDFKYDNYKWIEWNDLNGIRFECIEKTDNFLTLNS